MEASFLHFLICRAGDIQSLTPQKLELVFPPLSRSLFYLQPTPSQPRSRSTTVMSKIETRESFPSRHPSSLSRHPHLLCSAFNTASAIPHFSDVWLILVTTEKSLSFLGLFLNGEFVHSTGKETFTLLNAASEEKVATLEVANLQDVDIAVGHAKAAVQAWEDAPALTRATAIYKLADLIEQHADRLKEVSPCFLGRVFCEIKI